MTIRAVFFDMGGTIQTFSYTRELRLAATPGLQGLLRSAGISLPFDTEQLYMIVSDGLAHYHSWSIESKQELPPDRVWREFILEGCSVDNNALVSIAEDLMVYIETRYYHRKMRPEIPTVLEAIQKMGYKIGLISNVCSRKQVPTNLIEYGISHYFNPVVLSSEYGRRKPDPAIFHYAARLANVPTSECLYVGDRIARDIVGARNAGFGLAIQIKNDFKHGEVDQGATPNAIIDEMTELLDILKDDKLKKEKNSPADAAKTQRVRALLFDAGDILYYRPERGYMFAGFLHDMSVDPRDCHPTEREILVKQSYRGQISQDQLREAIIRLHGITKSDEIDRGKRILEEEDEDIKFFDGVQQTLLELKHRGFLLGIVTDTANPIYVKLSWFEKGGFQHVWDSIISSQEIGFRKPDPRIYCAALDQLGVTPENVAFIGHKTSELDGARALGIKTIAFNNEPDASADFYIQNFSDLLTLPIVN